MAEPMSDAPTEAPEAAAEAVDTPPAPPPPNAADGGSGLFVVGVIGDDGPKVLAATDQPDDATEVWAEDAPEERMALDAFDLRYEEGEIGWYAEPEPYFAEPARTAAADMADDTFDPADLDELEAKLGALESLIAGVMLSGIEDERFAEDDEVPAPQRAVLASAQAATRRYMAAVVAGMATDDEEAEVIDEPMVDEPTAEDDTVAEEVGDDDVADESEDRLERIKERLAKLETALAEVLENMTDDEQIIDETEVDDVSTVDERVETAE